MRAAKRQVEADVKSLQGEILKMAKEHAQNMAEANKVLADSMKEKDAMTQKMMEMMMNQFRGMMNDANEKNDRQFNRLMDRMERQDERIGDILDRMDKRIEMLERARAKKDGLDLEPANYTGAQLYLMVEERKAELAGKGSFVAPIRFQRTAPIVSAAFAAIGAVTHFTGIDQSA